MQHLPPYRDLVAAAIVTAAPLVLIALFVLPDPKYMYRELIQVFTATIAVTQSMYVLVGGAIGVAIGRRVEIGPVRSASALTALALAAGGVALGWLWFALNVASDF